MFSPTVLLAMFFSLMYRLGISSFPISTCVSSLALALGIVCCVMLSSFPYKIGAAVDLPCFLGCCVCNYLVGLPLSCFGHARAKNNSE